MMFLDAGIRGRKTFTSELREDWINMETSGLTSIQSDPFKTQAGTGWQPMAGLGFCAGHYELLIRFYPKLNHTDLTPPESLTGNGYSYFYDHFRSLNRFNTTLCLGYRF